MASFSNKMIELSSFGRDIDKGLSADLKYISSKYFYDDEGSRLFQKIMALPEYYLTNCEHEIFANQSHDIYQAFNRYNEEFELIELGAGDGSKTSTLVEFFLKKSVNFRFTPIDISTEALSILEDKFRKRFPDLNMAAKPGDYFEILHTLKQKSLRKKIILFLGSNIGNFGEDQSIAFFTQLRKSMNREDCLFIGFDLHKAPQTILSAYSDAQGVTKAFNMNLLKRLNKELGANFDANFFTHYASYNPIEKAAKSFLISLENQKVRFESLKKEFEFKKWEAIFMEVSQKYTFETIEKLALETGFKVSKNFTDSRGYYTNSLWKLA